MLVMAPTLRSILILIKIMELNNRLKKLLTHPFTMRNTDVKSNRRLKVADQYIASLHGRPETSIIMDSEQENLDDPEEYSPEAA